MDRNYSKMLDFINGKIWIKFSNKKDWDYIIDYVNENLHIQGNISYLKDNFKYYDCLKLGCNNDGFYLIRTNYYHDMKNVEVYNESDK